jgi:hypothetical protein
MAAGKQIQPNEEMLAIFEQGVTDYFDECGDCLAHEKPHQLWLGIVLARRIPIHRLLIEFDVPNKDVVIDTPLKTSRGVVSFDLSVAKENRIDARKFWTRYQKRKVDDTTAETVNALQQVCIIAELKTNSTATTRGALRKDLWKLCGAMKFLKRQGATKFPTCYLIVLDPERKLPVEAAKLDVMEHWPDGVPEPRIIVGP